jgi:hypothetical protein
MNEDDNAGFLKNHESLFIGVFTPLLDHNTPCGKLRAKRKPAIRDGLSPRRTTHRSTVCAGRRDDPFHFDSGPVIDYARAQSTKALVTG